MRRYEPRTAGEPNDHRHQATPTAETIVRGTLQGGDVDWYRLAGQEGTHPSFTIEHPAGADFDFEVYNGHDLVGRAVGTSSGDTISCIVPGACYLKVWCYSGSGEYRIHIRRQ